MATRWMQAKLDRQKTERPHHKRFAANDAPMAQDAKPLAMRPRIGHDMETSNRLAAQLLTMRQQYNGVVTWCGVGENLPAIGKGRREFNNRAFGKDHGLGGDGRRITRDWRDAWVDSGSVLIKRT